MALIDGPFLHAAYRTSTDRDGSVRGDAPHGGAEPMTQAVPGAVQVVFESVGKVFAPRGTTPVAALSGVSFEVRRGEVFGIIGRSGAGKSTLIRLVNGLERPTSGRVLLDGEDVGGLDTAGLTRLRRRVGMIFQGFNLLSARTALDNVALPLRFAGVSKTEARRRAAEALDLVGLADKARAYPARLSGGQKQRVGIARALVQEPSLLLSDEATSALDPETTRSILALLKDINRRLGLTVILITHEMEVIRAIADRVAVIEAGRIVEIGPVWRVFGDPEDTATRALLRPDVGTVPDDIRHVKGLAVIELDFTGGTGDPDLFAIGAALGPGGRLLHGGVDRLQGRSQGRLLVGTPVADRAAVEALADRLSRLAPKVEVISHG